MPRAKLMGPSTGQRPRLSTTQPRLSRPRPTTPSWLNLSGPSPIPRGLVGARFRLNRSVSGAGYTRHARRPSTAFCPIPLHPLETFSANHARGEGWPGKAEEWPSQQDAVPPRQAVKRFAIV